MIANQIRLLALALDRYTRFPVPAGLINWAHHDGLDPRRALRFAPLMSVVVGIYGALAYLVFAQILPHPVALILAVIASAVIGGAPHERGHVRLLGTGRGRREAALVALALVLILRIHTLIELDPSWVSLALITSAPFACGLAVALSIGTAAAPGAGGPRVPLWSDRLVALLIGVLPVLWAAHYFDQTLPFAFAVVPACAVALIARLRLGALLRQPLHAPLRRTPGAIIPTATGTAPPTEVGDVLTETERDTAAARADRGASVDTSRPGPEAGAIDAAPGVAAGRRRSLEQRWRAALAQAREALPSGVQQCAELAFLVGLLAWWSLIGSEQMAADSAAASDGGDEGFGDGGGDNPDEGGEDDGG